MKMHDILHDMKDTFADIIFNNFKFISKDSFTNNDQEFYQAYPGFWWWYWFMSLIAKHCEWPANMNLISQKYDIDYTLNLTISHGKQKIIILVHFISLAFEIYGNNNSVKNYKQDFRVSTTKEILDFESTTQFGKNRLWKSTIETGSQIF